MKKIIGMLLLSILVFAENNHTNLTQENYFEEKQLLKSENILLKTANKTLQNDIKKLILENKTLKENKGGNTLDIKSIPKLELDIKQPTNLTLIFLPLITMMMIIVGFLITRKQLINSDKKTLHAFNETIKQEKELKQKEILANNRQEWINHLRNELSVFISSMVNYNNLELQTEHEEIDVNIANKQRFEFLYQAIESKAKIHLLLNPSEKNAQNLIKLMGAMVESKYEKEKDLARLIEPLINLSQDILKKEWEKIKEL